MLALFLYRWSYLLWLPLLENSLTTRKYRPRHSGVIDAPSFEFILSMQWVARPNWNAFSSLIVALTVGRSAYIQACSRVNFGNLHLNPSSCRKVRIRASQTNVSGLYVKLCCVEAVKFISNIPPRDKTHTCVGMGKLHYPVENDVLSKESKPHFDFNIEHNDKKLSGGNRHSNDRKFGQ